MSLLTSYISNTVERIHNGVIQTVASVDPETLGEAQISEWICHAARLAQISAKALAEVNEQSAKIVTIEADIARYTSAAEKLGETNPTVAEKAADNALKLSETLADEKATLADHQAWYVESRLAAVDAQEKVGNARKAIEDAKHEQARAQHEAEVAKARLAERQEVLGITKTISGSDMAINALKKNAQESRINADAAKLQTEVLGSAVNDEDAINKALECISPAKTETLAEKLARLKK
jgi:hypothetical protein